LATGHVPHTCPRCIVCKEQAVVFVPEAGLKAWTKGALIQVAFPDTTPDERELLLTGTHPKCWDSMFGGDEM
jgi:hypothetical protein